MPSATLVEFETADNLFLPGLLYEPEKKSKKVALVLHGNGSSSILYHVEKNNAFAESLNKEGIAYFPFNNRGAHLMKRFSRALENGEKEDVNCGSGYERIKDCILDIEGAVKFLQSQGYSEFYLIGYSTGANKILVYNYYRPQNPFSKFVLLGGGDDTGIYFQMAGSVKKLQSFLQKAKAKIESGQGEKLVPKYMSVFPYSYQAYYDIANPDGDYNTFPFWEVLNKLSLSKKELWREYKSLRKPTLVMYGGEDKYCYGKVAECVEILKKQKPKSTLFELKIIKGADHSFMEHAKELVGEVTDFLTNSKFKG